jgi:hypothetical protein
MTPTARTVLPTDLVALVSYDGRVYANEAMTLDRIGTHDSPHPLETAFEQWFSFATGRHTWISVKGPTLRGLASARKRGSKLVWEIDCLIDADEGDDGVLLSLLDQVTEAAGRSGALRIFVRLPSGSMIERGASRCGFAPYRHEQVYRRDIAGNDAQPPEALRRRGKSDLYPVFQLYNAQVPAEIRRYEAATFAEWTGAIEHIGRATQYVLEHDGRVHGWLRVAGDGDIGRFDLLAGHQALDDLIEAAMAKLANRQTAYTLVPAHQSQLAERLAERGFTPGEEFTVLSRRTVHPVKEARTVPAVARTTFG